MKKTYHPKFPMTIFLVMITSWFFSLKLFSNWKISGSTIYLVFAIFFLLVFMIFSKPLLEWKRIEIENGYISVFKRFYKPLRINIAESLYQVVVMDDYIRSFHFKCGKYYRTQISPVIYKNGDEMTKTLSNYILKHNIDVDVIIN